MLKEVKPIFDVDCAYTLSPNANNLYAPESAYSVAKV